MPEQLHFSLLGGLQIFLDETPLTGLRTKKTKALLCYLAVTGRSFSRPALAGLLWGDTPEPNALMNLRKSLTELRRSVPEYLVTTRQSVSLNSDLPHWLDVRVLETTLSKIKGLNRITAADIRELETAANFYKGEFLDGFYVNNAPEFEDWVLIQRVRLKDVALDALGTIANYHSNRGEYETGIEFTKRILALEPWLEEAHRDLMLLYAQNGQRSLALVQYKKCRQILEIELGVEPSADTSTLYEKIRRGEISPPTPPYGLSADPPQFYGPGAPKSSAADANSTPTNVPPQPLDIVGRTAELTDLGDKIANRNTRLISIVGPGGIGKTRLALEFAQNQLEGKFADSSVTDQRFPDGVYFVPLASLEAGELIAPAIAEALRLRLDYGETQLLDYLNARQILLVLDNFEHLIEEGKLVSSILHSAPDVSIIVTSRERLRLQEEHVYPLNGLDYPDLAFVGMEDDFPAGKLFVQAVQRQQPDFSLAEQDVELVARICQIVEGMPLALELAASWTAAMPLADIHSEIQRSFDFLTAEYRNIPERHRSLRAVIDISWERLSPNGQKLFSELSIFRGGFTREAAEAITQAAIQDLSGLVGKSLLRYENSENRFFVHELLRQYGAEKLSQDKASEEELRGRHSQYYLLWLENQINPINFKVQGQKTALEQVSIELENARAAWIWSLGNSGDGWRISSTQMDRIGVYFIARGGYLEGDRAFRNIAERLADIDKSSDVSTIILNAASLYWQTVFVIELGDRSTALRLLQESKDLLNLPQLADTDLLDLRAHHLVLYTRADRTQPYDVRLERLAQATMWYREAENPLGLAFALTNSALLAIVTGRLKQAQEFLEESLSVQNDSGNQMGLTVSYTDLGILAFVKNDYRKAQEWLQKSVDVAQELGNLHRITAGAIYFGTVHIYSGQFNRAREILKKCVSDSADLGIRPRQATALNYLSYSHLHLGDYDAAIDLGRVGLTLARETDNIEMIAQASMLFGAIALARENFNDALDRFQEADGERAARPFVEIVNGADCGRIGLAAALGQLGRVDEAQEILDVLWQRASESRRLDQALQAIVGKALLFAIKGQDKKARELYALAASQPFIGSSRWFHDAFGKYVLPDSGVPAPDNSGETGSFQEIWDAVEALLT